MDDPSVSLLFKQKSETTLQERDNVLIDVGTCPFRIASNTFREGLKILSADFGIDLDQIVLDLYGFLNTPLKEFMISLMLRHLSLLITKLQGRRMLKHVPTRWVSIQDV